MAVIALVAFLTRPSSPGPQLPIGCTVAAVSGPGTFTITPEQAQNASIIAGVAAKDGLADHAVTVALATALRESHLLDLPYGDLDSVGLFQQRPSQGWGTTAELLDPIYATNAFYRRLVQVPGWSTMAVTDAAQSVQHSATPLAYAVWEPEARALAVALTGELPEGFSCRLAGYAGTPPAASALAAAAQQEMGSKLLGAPVDTKTGWALASWAVAHAWSYHLSQVTFGRWKWQATSGKWVDTGRVGAPPVVQLSYKS